MTTWPEDWAQTSYLIHQDCCSAVMITCCNYDSNNGRLMQRRRVASDHGCTQQSTLSLFSTALDIATEDLKRSISDNFNS